MEHERSEPGFQRYLLDVDALEQRLLECGYETRWLPGWQDGKEWHRVELESPYHRGDYTAGEGAERRLALTQALSCELRRLAPELQALLLAGFEQTE